MMRPAVIALFAGLLVLPVENAAQDSPAGRHDIVIEHLKKTAAGITASCLADVGSREEWTKLRPLRRRQVLSMLGLDPLPARTPLEARVTGTLERSGYRIENVVFQSSPGLYATSNLYLPEGPPAPLPTVVYVCGHSPHPLGAKWNYQDHAVWFAEHGYNCLIIDTLEFGEVAGIHHGTHDLNMWSWLSLGYTPAGVEVWNVIRAIDYLETRPEVDAGRIGITGRSGGGAVSWYAAAVDERIAAAAPVCGTFTFGSQASHWIAAGQCDCIYFHNTYLVDLPTVGALIAPRPLLIVSGRRDGIFPPDGYHEVHRQLKRIYELHGASERVFEFDEDVGHQSTPLMRRAAREWMNRWLRSDTSPLEAEPVPREKRETAEDLACLSRLPRDATNYRIHESFVPVARIQAPKTLAAWKKRRQHLLDQLKEDTFRWFPRGSIPFRTTVSRNRGGWASRYAEYEDVRIDTEAGVPVRVQLLRTRNRSAEIPLVLYAKRRGDSIYPFDIDELLPLLGRCDVAILNPRLTEDAVDAAEYADIERTSAWIGRTVASMQVWDVLRAVRWLLEEKKLSPASVSVYGKGEMGIVCLYAGLLDERIGRVILSDPPVSHWSGPALLNVLRLTDIPEAAAVLAPRELVLLRHIPSELELTRTVYALYGDGSRVETAGSLPEAVEIWKYGR